VFDQKKRQHTFGDSAGDKIWFHNRSFDLCMGSQCDIDKKNVIMVNNEELSEEDQRKYTELQEYIKHQFLSGAKKDRSCKVTLNQDFELPAIKLNKEKVKLR
jgi:vacuolar-type H+-ATPase subunit B/Vma2